MVRRVRFSVGGPRAARCASSSPRRAWKNQRVYARAEYSVTACGDPSYEIGGACRAPLVEGKVGLRVSVFHCTNSGSIDGVTGTPVVVSPTGAAGP